MEEKRRSTARDWCLVALFAGLISLPGLVQLAAVRGPDVASTRALAPPPQWLGFARLRDLAKATEAYVDDRFGLKRQLVRWNSLLRYRVGLSGSPQVVIGTEGWLFYNYPPEKILEQHTGENVFTPDELERWVAVMTANRDWLARRGIAFFIVIAPDKSTIYPEKLPTYPRPPGRTTRTDQLAERLKSTDLIVVDPREALAAAKKGPAPYSAGDSHWTEAGAYVAYRQLMERVQETFPGVEAARPEDYQIAPGPGPNDQAFLLGLETDLTYTVERWTRRTSHQIRTVTRNPKPGDPWGWPVRFVETDLKDKPRLLVFGDSFTDYVLGPTFLYETFRDPVYTHHNGGTFDFRLVYEAKPDVVIVELADRYLASQPQPPLGF